MEGSSFILHPEEIGWMREGDSNPRPLGYEPNELPTATISL